MLIDSTHRRWFLATLLIGSAAYILHRVLNAGRPEPLTGSSFANLWYGIAGSLLMIYAGLWPATARPVRRWLGARQTWLRGHIWLGGLSGVFLSQRLLLGRAADDHLVGRADRRPGDWGTRRRPAAGAAAVADRSGTVRGALRTGAAPV